MNHDQAMIYLAENRRGVLTTIQRDGRAQMSLIDYGLDSDGKVKIQVFEPSAKVRNMRRDPRVSMSVIGDDWGEYLVVEGIAELVEGDERLSALRHAYQLIGGAPHPDWDEFNRAMIDEGQVVMSIQIERLYPIIDER
jgi:PPOX class probable F420-dependent enzyme